MFRKSAFITIFLLAALMFCQKKNPKLDWDVFGYYLYLPSTFIFHDIKLERKALWLDPIMEKYNTTDGFYQAHIGPQGTYVMKYTMGLSILYSPFFFTADLIAPLIGYERDGFSPPYQYAMMICALLFSVLGIWYFFKLMSLYFNDNIVIVTASFIVFGTNYFTMASYDGLMPHNFIFTLFAILLYNTIQWYEHQKLKYALMVGLCAGLAVLIRPTSIIALIIPVLWDLSGWNELKNRVQLIAGKWKHFALAVFVFVLALLPQMIYWKMAAGSWIYYSYPGERVNLLTPHLMDVLFSYKKGWLLYTPIMIFAIAGFYFLYFSKRKLFLSLIIFFIINTYVISCWDTWWYGGSFSQRPFVESYVFMAFPLAALISYFSAKKTYVYVPLIAIGLFLSYVNIFHGDQVVNIVLFTEQLLGSFFKK
jgi:hypothetical protein